MNRTLTLPLVLFAFGAAVVAGAPGPQTAPRSQAAEQPAAQVRAAIETGNATWERGFRGLDPAAIASTFDSDGVNVGADGTYTKGPAAIEAAMRSYFERSGPAVSTKVEIKDFVVDGDLAYEWGHSEFHFAPKPGGPAQRVNRYLAIWKRQSDGGWKILRNLGLPERP